MSWRHVTQLACLLAVLTAPVAAQARLADQIGDSIAEMSELVTLESQTNSEVDASFTAPDHALPTPIDLVVGDIPYLPDLGMLRVGVPFSGWWLPSTYLPCEPATQRYARLQVFRF